MEDNTNWLKEMFTDEAKAALLSREGAREGGGYKITNFRYFCYSNTRYNELENIDTSNGTDFSYMFSSCNNVSAIPTIDTSNGTNFKYMFELCSALTTIPELDTSKGTNFAYMFRQCYALTAIPELDTSNGTEFANMFRSCTGLTTIPKLDLRNIGGSNTAYSGMFENCAALTNLYLYNICCNLQIGSGTSWGHLLTVDSIVHTIKELKKTTLSRTLTMGSANLEKIANLYCKITDYEHEKKTMELCESTDEGAMTLTDYVAEKGWRLA